MILAACSGLAAQEQTVPNQIKKVQPREVHTIFIDDKNHSVSDVTGDEVQLIQDGAQQTIESFSLREMPIRYGLLIDTTGSLRGQFPAVVETVKSLVLKNRPGDETFMAGFVDSSQINH